MVVSLNRRPSSFRPSLEALEDRLAPAQVTWTGLAGNGNWSSALNWSSRKVPTAADDVVINGTGTITHSSLASDSVHSIQGDQPLVIAGGSLTLGTTSQLGNLTLSGGYLIIRSGTLQLGTSVHLGGNFLWNGGTLAGPGSIKVTADGTLTGADGNLTLYGVTLDNYGSLTWTAGHIATGGGSGIINEGNATFTVAGGTQFDPAFANGGTFTFSSSSTIAFAGFTNTGHVDLTNGIFQSATFIQTAGTTTLAGGTLEAVSTVSLQGGTLAGHGNVLASVGNAGAVIAPDAGQVLDIGGYYAQSSGGQLLVAIDPSGAGYPAPLDVQGIASLSGTLSVEPTGSVQGGRFDPVLKATRITGQFASVSSPAPGYTVTTQYNPTQVKVALSETQGSPVPPANPPGTSSTGTQTSGTTSTSGIFTATNTHSSTTAQTGSASSAGPTAAASTVPRDAGPPPGQGRIGGMDPAGSLLPGVGGTGGPPLGLGRLAEGAVGDMAAGATALARSAAAAPSPSGTDRSSGRMLDPDGGADELFRSFRLVVPEVDLPSEKDLLSAGDVASALVVGGRARADVFAKGGSRLSVVATVVTTEDEVATGEAREASPLMDLFVNPLQRRFEQIVVPESGPRAGAEPRLFEAPPADLAVEAGQGEALRLALLATASALGMLAVRLPEREQRSAPPGDTPAATP
jgi:hypothetical protein